VRVRRHTKKDVRTKSKSVSPRSWQARPSRGAESVVEALTHSAGRRSVVLDHTHVLALRILPLGTAELRRILRFVADKQGNVEFDPDLPVRMEWDSSGRLLRVVNDAAGAFLSSPLPPPDEREDG